MRYRINYSKVISQANQVAELARELTAQINALTAIEDKCRTVWQGEAANTFAAKVAAMKAELIRERRKIDNLASTIKYCADKIYNEDRRAAEMAASLKIGQ